jgi:hypothetical protein
MVSVCSADLRRNEKGWEKNEKGTVLCWNEQNEYQTGHITNYRMIETSAPENSREMMRELG